VISLSLIFGFSSNQVYLYKDGIYSSRKPYERPPYSEGLQMFEGMDYGHKDETNSSNL
jgi:hypothetical protein